MRNLVNQLIKKVFLVIAFVLVASTIVGTNTSKAFNLSSVLSLGENEEEIEVIETERLASLSGSGTEESPYIINTVEDLNAIRDDLSAYYKLGANIDLQGIDWEPIGDDTNGFTGSLDGNGKTISNLTINSENDNVGLFGVLSGTVKQLGLENVNVKGNNNVGAVAGKIKTEVSIELVYITGSVEGNDNVGGLCGLVNNIKKGGKAKIDRCYTIANVKGNTSVGGLIGFNNTVQTSGSKNVNTIIYSNCFIGGKIEGNDMIGGLIGQMKRRRSKGSLLV